MFRATAKPPAPPPAFTREAWFEALDSERKAAFVARHTAECARDAELARRAQREFWRQGVPTAVLLALGDLCSPYRSIGSICLALLFGAAVGLACERWNYGRFRTSTLALFVFLALEIATRGGLAPRHFFVLFPLSAVAAYFGYQREERGFD
ncbi:MAG: hypothetical protein HZA53_17190 [Planctomycetes bacterium]|nr:hypothetical protein [Planctomycetota bacterium]